MKTEKTKHTERAFTILEMLVSMAIITMIALMVANIFQSSSESWNVGTRRTQVNIAGRAAMEFMARELSQAVAGRIESAEANNAGRLDFHVDAYNDIAFLALSQNPSGTQRALRATYFWQDSATLKYGRQAQNLDCYTDLNWKSKPNGFSVIANVAYLEFLVYESQSDLVGNSPVGVFPSSLTNLPFCVDIFLSILDDDGGTNNFSTRVHFPNRKGYK